MADHTDLIAAAQAVVDATTQLTDGTWVISGDGERLIGAQLDALEALSTHRRGEGEGATPFWVLEDPRCRSWSPTPQYLHKAAEFYGTGKWGKLGGGNELTTPDIGQARRFANRVQAEAFRDASPDLTAWAYEPCEHAMIGAMATPPAREGNDWAEHEDEIADAITDSIDMDWSSRDGARAVVRFLNSLALSTPPVQQEGELEKLRADLAEAIKDRAAHADHVLRMARECEAGLAALTEIDEAWEQFGIPNNRSTLTLPEQIASTLRELDASLSTSAEPVQKTPETEHVGGLQEGEPAAYDAGLLGDYGGGDVGWWQDYLRSELARAHDFYVSQLAHPVQPWSPDREAVERLLVEHLRKINRVIASGHHEGAALKEAADAILSLRGGEEEEQGSSVAESASTPDGRTEDQRAAGWRPSERFKAWSGGMDTEGENAGEFTAQVVFANHADCVSFLRFFATFDPAESSAEEDRS